MADFGGFESHLLELLKNSRDPRNLIPTYKTPKSNLRSYPRIYPRSLLSFSQKAIIITHDHD